VIAVLRAGWRVRRNLRRHRAWVAYYERCPAPPGTSCAECATSAREHGDADHHRRWVEHLERLLARRPVAAA
jgi:hypothetical protein